MFGFQVVLLLTLINLMTFLYLYLVRLELILSIMNLQYSIVGERYYLTLIILM